MTSLKFIFDFGDNISIGRQTAGENTGRARSHKKRQQHDPSILVQDKTWFLIILKLNIDVVVFLEAGRSICPCTFHRMIIAIIHH